MRLPEDEPSRHCKHREPRGLPAFLAIAAVLVVVAYGGNQPAGSTTTSTQRVVLHMLALSGAYEDYWKQTIAAFEQAYPGYTINREIVAGGDALDQKFNAYAQARSGPDLVAIQGGAFYLPYKAALQPLNELRLDTADYYGPEMFCQDFDCKKNIYAVPYNLQGYVLYYNKSILKSVGWAPNNPPRTWRAMADACPKIQAAGKICWALGVSRTGGGQLMNQLVQQTTTLAQQQGLLNGTTKFTDPEFINAIKLFMDAMKRGWFNEDAPSLQHIGGAESLFASGKAAFIMGFVAEVENYGILGKAIGEQNLGAMPVPAIEPNFPLEGVSPGPLSKLSAIAGATGWAVPVWSKNKGAALQWIRFAGNADNQQRMLQYSMPARKGLNITAVGSPALQQIQALVRGSRGNLLAFYTGNAVYGQCSIEFAKLWLGQATVEQAAQNLQNVLNQLRR